MLLAIQRNKFGILLPELSALWPKDGHWCVSSSLRLSTILRKNHGSVWLHKKGSFPRNCVVVDTNVTSARLVAAGERLARSYATPWKYQHHFDTGPSSRYSTLKIRPGATIPIALNGIDTTAHVNTVRRMRHRGSPHFLHMNIVVDTKNIPITLDRETLCDCVYCGTPPKGDESNCRGCGAPLPAC